MGLRLPIFPYHAAQGKEAPRRSATSYHNNRARVALERFQAVLSREDVKSDAFNLIRGRLRLIRGNWFRSVEFEEDDEEYPVLNRLLDTVGKHGTILVPDVTHIVGKKDEKRLSTSPVTRQLVERIDAENIEILPLVLKLENKTYDLRKCANCNEPGKVLFELMPQIAMDTTEYLKRALNGSQGKRRSL